jgi:endonuclease YncB( thermonuclease family)
MPQDKQPKLTMTRIRNYGAIAALAWLYLSGNSIHTNSDGISTRPASSSAKPAAVLEGVARVIDGNTLEIGSARITMAKYNACPPGQKGQTATGIFDCGAWAKQALAQLVEGRTVKCTIITATDKTKALADCIGDDGQDPAITMIAGGYGLANKRYPASRAMQAAAAQAKAKRAGIWSFKNFKQAGS